jgi:hypothetical protein
MPLPMTLICKEPNNRLSGEFIFWIEMKDRVTQEMHGLTKRQAVIRYNQMGKLGSLLYPNVVRYGWKRDKK